MWSPLRLLNSKLSPSGVRKTGRRTEAAASKARSTCLATNPGCQFLLRLLWMGLEEPSEQRSIGHSAFVLHGRHSFLKSLGSKGVYRIWSSSLFCLLAGLRWAETTPVMRIESYTRTLPLTMLAPNAALPLRDQAPQPPEPDRRLSLAVLP